MNDPFHFPLHMHAGRDSLQTDIVHIQGQRDQYLGQGSVQKRKR